MASFDSHSVQQLVAHEAEAPSASSDCRQKQHNRIQFRSHEAEVPSGGGSSPSARPVLPASCERINHTWAFPLHMYLYKNYNPNHKWEITTLKTLHDLEDQGVMSHNVTYL
jgi:hypothetical protein